MSDGTELEAVRPAACLAELVAWFRQELPPGGAVSAYELLLPGCPNELAGVLARARAVLGTAPAGEGAEEAGDVLVLRVIEWPQPGAAARYGNGAGWYVVRDTPGRGFWPLAGPFLIRLQAREALAGLVRVVEGAGRA